MTTDEHPDRHYVAHSSVAKCDEIGGFKPVGSGVFLLNCCLWELLPSNTDRLTRRRFNKLSGRLKNNIHAGSTFRRGKDYLPEQAIKQ